jgi:hypothetical protein
MPCAAFGAPEIVLIAISIAHVFVASRLLRLGRMREQSRPVRSHSGVSALAYGVAFHQAEFDADRNQSDVLRRFGWESRSALKQQKFSAGIGTLVTVMHLAQYFGIGCFC